VEAGEKLFIQPQSAERVVHAAVQYPLPLAVEK
jgi:hypothetical protein